MKKNLLFFLGLLLTLSAMAQDRKITGTIVNEDTGEPLSGVSIMTQGRRVGHASGAKGDFAFMIPDKGEVVLIFTYTGFNDLTIHVGASNTLEVKMKANDKKLDEVVVIGYGTVRKRDLTGAVVSVKPEEIQKVPAGNVMESLQGKVAGVDIVRTSGLAGMKADVTVRGNRSVIAGNGPLYIVDGIQYDDYQDINANDIASMEVLKDASSTAIYGSKGANGVIIITTKKGAAGKTAIFANAYYGRSEVADYPLSMSGPQFTALKREAFRATNHWSSTADDATVFTASELAGIKNNTSTYWPGLLIKKGTQQDYGIGVSSGSEKTKVYFSFDYFRETGILKNDYSNRFSLRLNIDQTIAPSFKVGLLSQFTYYKGNSRAEGVLTVANKIKPLYLPYNPDGSIVNMPGADNQVNPLLDDVPGAYVNLTNTSRIFSTAYAEWKPVKGLTLRSNLGVVNSSSRNGFFEAANSYDGINANGSSSLSKVSNGTFVNLTWENIVTYARRFGDHNLEVTAVSSYLSNRTDSSSAKGTGQLLAGQQFYGLQNNPNNLAVFSNYVGSNLLAGTFRVNYGYKGKYLLTVTGRADGSSVLAPKNHWAFFPSVAGAWRMSDESFMTSQNLFSDLKVRASYGVSGNAAVKAYQTQSAIVLVPTEWNDQKSLAYALNLQTGNPDLKWELTGTADAGLDFGLFKDRLTGSIDFYDSKTHDLLILRQLPASSGVQKVLQNIGKTRNKGIEVSLRTENVQTTNFSWSSSVTFTSNKERITSLPDNQNDIADLLFIGSPVKSFYDYQKIGVWQSADSVLAKKIGVASGNPNAFVPGAIRVRDVYNRGKITADSDRVVVGSAVPKYSIGFSNDIRWKNFDLNIYVFARVGQTFLSSYANKFEPNAIENSAVVNYWTPENPTNDYPRPNSGFSRATMPYATTLGYKDGTFVKIRTMTLGYTLPASLARRLHVAGFRWYVSAKNYISFNKVKDYDPEGGGSFEGPLTKLLVTGLNVRF